MSTFNGLMPEFPDIRVDYFRTHPGLRPPLACFLSHVHSDHLAGLESLKAPFVYCSAATREMLLKLERYTNRLDYWGKVLEARKRKYKHLKALLKPLPLDTPTVIELEPGNEIQVTLFDANHCTGAVMFLIEGNGKAVLYTGDIRCEPWHVAALARNPVLLDYTTHGSKVLDCLYLDTSFLEPYTFPSKAEGLQELLEKVAEYPPDTVFHFAAWTFGYEQVWIALAHALKTRIHVDPYKLGLYKKLVRKSGELLAPEAAALVGFKCGNRHQPGCLTSDTSVRLHSCEKGMQCSAIGPKTVFIQPIIARTKDGKEIAEIGVGGGGHDLRQKLEVELDGADAVVKLREALRFHGWDEDEIESWLRKVGRPNNRTLPIHGLEPEFDLEDLDDEGILAQALSNMIRASDNRANATPSPTKHGNEQGALPQTITFPYSRHSSLNELQHLVGIFRPKDVYPCTVDESSWTEDVSMERLFGKLCSATGTRLRHDIYMRQFLTSRPPAEDSRMDHDGATPPRHSSAEPTDDERSGAGSNATGQDGHKRARRRSSIEGELRKRPCLYDRDGNERGPLHYIDNDGKQQDFPVHWDDEENVYRHTSCGHEIWNADDYVGHCTRCEIGPEAYLEGSDTDTPFRMYRASATESASAYSSDDQDWRLGDYLETRSAYDSMDGDSVITCNDYEMNSFIDDDDVEGSSDPGHASSSDGGSDGDVDAPNVRPLEADLASLRGLLSGEDSDEDDHDVDIASGSPASSRAISCSQQLLSEYDAEGNVLINPVVVDLTTASITLVDDDEDMVGMTQLEVKEIMESHEEEDLIQTSADRRQRRRDAAERANQRAWDGVLISTSGEHSVAEVEL